MLGLIYKIALLKEWQHVMANNVYAPNSKNTTIAIKQKIKHENYWHTRESKPGPLVPQ